MFQVLNCLTTAHDWRLVVLAGFTCLLASVVAISLFDRAQATQGGARVTWLVLNAAAVGYGIWATHFIAMLAYNPGAGAGYDFLPTLLSLVLAGLITGAGYSLVGPTASTRMTAFAGVIVGLGIAAMHFTGMRALELPGRITWSLGLVLAAVVIGCALSALSLLVAAKSENWKQASIAALLLTLAVVSLHFTAMGAVLYVPDPTRVPTTSALSPTSLSLIVAGIAAFILCMCLVASLSERQSHDKLQRQKSLLDAAIENMSQGLCMFDADGRVLLFNERYAKMFDMSPASLKGKSLLSLLKGRGAQGISSDNPEELCASVIAAARAGKPAQKNFETPTGRTIRIADHPIKGGGWVSTFEDITDWLQAQAKISHLARHDPLTDLPNRRYVREHLEQVFERNERAAVLCIDLDHFKDVNDSLGHPIGDDLLKEVGRRLNACLFKNDLVARLGGDEFAIVHMSSGAQASDAANLAARIVDVVSAPYDIQGHQVVIGASVGIAVAPEDGRDADHLLKNADMALYLAKTDGRGTFRFFEAGMDARAQARRLLMLDLRSALSRNEFEVYYQPIHDVETGRIISFEALVRWIHPLCGVIPPANFIPLAEETGLIVQIGEWVLQRACMDAASWQTDVGVAVNLSATQFKNRNLVPMVLGALAASGLPAKRLELEITETVLLQDCDAMLAALHKLRAAGIRISMDDFGTGYSSLSYLRSFPFDKIKIDQSFIRELASRGDSMAIVRAVTGLGRSLGIPITAEGVETSEQLELLRAEGCTQVQGYLFNPPRPVAEVAKMLSEGRLRRVA